MTLLLAFLACDATPTDSDSDVPVTPTPPTESLPFLVDPLAIPETPTHSVDDFHGSDECAACHVEHAAEWRTSMHAYAMVDPVFRAMTELRNTDRGGREDPFCTQCHTLIGNRSGETVRGFDFADLSPKVLEGINCETCHKASAIQRPFQAGLVLDPTGPVRGVTNRSSSFHETEALPELADSAFCGSCHDVYETNGLPLERPYEEWLTSSAPDAGQTCQTCHMPARPGPIVQGGEESVFHSHRFVGVDLPLVEGFITDDEEDALRASIIELLDGAATVDVQVTDAVPGGIASAVVTVQNELDAHNFPTGSTFIRQTWVEVVATVDGVPVYETGTLDANGDLRDYFSELDPFGDDDLLALSSAFTAPSGEPTLFSWHASEHTSLSLAPGYSRTWTLFLPLPDTPGELEVRARILLRPFQPHLLRRLGLNDEAERLPIYTVDETLWTAPAP